MSLGAEDCSHGPPWVSLSDGVLMEYLTDFHDCWVTHSYLHPCSKDPVSHLVRGFFLTLDPMGNLFVANSCYSAAQLIVHSEGLLCELALQKWCNKVFRILLVFRIICLGIFWEKKQWVCNMVDVPRIWETNCTFSTQLFFCHSVMLSISKSFGIYGYAEHV